MESNTWPSFHEMLMTPTSSSESGGDTPSAAPRGGQPDDSAVGALVVEPEVSMMDYSWNEDDIDIDFMTGKNKNILCVLITVSIISYLKLYLIV